MSQAVCGPLLRDLWNRDLPDRNPEGNGTTNANIVMSRPAPPHVGEPILTPDAANDNSRKQAGRTGDALQDQQLRAVRCAGERLGGKNAGDAS